MARAMRASGERKPNAMRVRSRILVLVGTVNLRSCGRFANHTSLIRHTRPGESRRRTGENRPRIAQVDSALLGMNHTSGLPVRVRARRLNRLKPA